MSNFKTPPSIQRTSRLKYEHCLHLAEYFQRKLKLIQIGVNYHLSDDAGNHVTMRNGPREINNLQSGSLQILTRRARVPHE